MKELIYIRCQFLLLSKQEAVKFPNTNAWSKAWSMHLLPLSDPAQGAPGIMAGTALFYDVVRLQTGFHQHEQPTQAMGCLLIQKSIA